MGRGDLTNHEWSLLVPHLPSPGGRGGRWNDHRTVLNGILLRVRTGVPWRDLPERYGSWKTVYERHRGWRRTAPGTGSCRRSGRGRPCRADRLGHGRRRLDVLPGPPTRGRRPQGQAAGPEKGTTPRHHRPDEGLGRSRGGLTSKIHLAGEGGCRPMALLITPGQWGDVPQMIEILDRIRVPRPLVGRPRTRPDHVSGDKAYSSRRNRRYLRRRRIKHTIPEPKDQRVNRRRRGSAGGRPVGFDRERYRRRNEVERTINRLKNSRAVATRYDKRAYVFHGTVTAAAVRL
ncbi:IS5 family transposase [Streptomyces sp. ICN441]|uniref:IS5 family transposase n=1 Tax=Streptomyces sp. ICN441 TaxID=2558286 RepID=UPI001F114A9B|nr:IS5 family transposase [Streptomyces sp. ICN441]